MSTEDAKRLIGEMENAAMNQAAQIVYDMLAANRKRMKDFGLVDEDTVMRGRIDTSSTFAQSLRHPRMERRTFPREATFRRDNLSGKEVFKALGRQSQAENPVLFAISDSGKDRPVSKS